MPRAYAVRLDQGRHRPLAAAWRRPLHDAEVVLLAVTTVVAAVGADRFGGWRCTATFAVAAALPAWLGRHGRLWLVGTVLVMVAGWHTQSAWQAAAPRQLGDYAGWATLVGDPTPVGAGLRVTLNIHGERFDAWLYGSARRRVGDRQSGQQLAVVGTRTALGAHARRAQARHVVGRFDVSFVGDWAPGSRLTVVDTRIRDALRRSAEASLPTAQAALFTGLVIGDDLRQPPAMVQSFRDAGLSHLTAVSGQNVAFVLAAAAPLLRRLRAGPRWAATVGLVVWFMALTRFEPSVLRAGVMAIMAATGFVLGRRQSPLRMLSLTVVLLVLIDPLLVWSVGFWLSVGATAGVVVVGPRLQGRLPGPAWFAAPLAVTLGAQVGVAVPSLLVFGRLPLVSLPANLLAVPVGGFVMLYGLPAGLLGAILPPLRAPVMFPAVVGTRWVEAVAALAPRFEPPSAWMLPGWAAVAVVTAIAVWHSRDSGDDVPI